MNSIDYITAHNNLAVLINAQVYHEYWTYEPANMQAAHALTPPESEIPQSEPPHSEPPQSGPLELDPVCISCDGNSGLKSFIAPCNHNYCANCLTSYISSALEASGTFPPACCNRPLTIQLVEDHVPEQLAMRYRTKQAAIKEACALICAQPGCGLIIEDPDIVGDLGHCLGCNRYTCKRCRTAKHKGKECPPDADREGVFKLAKEKGWQVCYRCSNMIELNFGCNHMACICGAEFCYVCGIMWKQCECALFAADVIDDFPIPHEPRFQRRTIFRADKALARYEKHLGQTLAWQDRRPREEQLGEIRAVIETGCDHGYWRRIKASKDQPGHCKLCHYVGRKFIFQCANCPLRACWACHTDEPPEFRRVDPEAEANA